MEYVPQLRSPSDHPRRGCCTHLRARLPGPWTLFLVTNGDPYVASTCRCQVCKLPFSASDMANLPWCWNDSVVRETLNWARAWKIPRSTWWDLSKSTRSHPCALGPPWWGAAEAMSDQAQVLCLSFWTIKLKGKKKRKENSSLYPVSWDRQWWKII